MEKIAAIVEGHTEAHFVKATYASVHVTRAIPNGRTVAIDVIVEAIVDAIEVLGGSISKVLILLDREDREMSAIDMAAAIRAGILQKCTGRTLYIGVTDRQIENWIIADEKKMRSLFDSTFQYAGDGTFGKGTLQSLSDGVYRAPGDNALLLKSCSATQGALKSPSLAGLISSIDFDWPWAKS